MTSIVIDNGQYLTTFLYDLAGRCVMEFVGATSWADARQHARNFSAGAKVGIAKEWFVT